MENTIVYCTIIVLIVLYVIFDNYKEPLNLHEKHVIEGVSYKIIKTSDSTKSDALSRLLFLKETAFIIATKLENSKATLLQSRLRKTTFSELSPPHTPYIASTINKGSVINICIRDAMTGSLLSKEHTLYVFVHELAHIITKSIGHTPEFNENMTLLVKACQEIGVLPHKIPPAFHCGEFLSFD